MTKKQAKSIINVMLTKMYRAGTTRPCSYTPTCEEWEAIKTIVRPPRRLGQVFFHGVRLNLSTLADEDYYRVINSEHTHSLLCTVGNYE